MSAIIGRNVKDADAFGWHSGSRGRRDVPVLWILQVFTCTMQGAEICWTREALRDEQLLQRYGIWG